MVIEAAKEMDRHCVINWLYKVYDAPSRAFDEYTEDELIMFAYEAIVLLKEQEARELTMDEWREWKANPKRNPICKLWENDTSPMWVLNPNDVHEPALLMGKLKLFTGKPTLDQCKAVNWNG